MDAWVDMDILEYWNWMLLLLLPALSVCVCIRFHNDFKSVFIKSFFLDYKEFIESLSNRLILLCSLHCCTFLCYDVFKLMWLWHFDIILSLFFAFNYILNKHLKWLLNAKTTITALALPPSINYNKTYTKLGDNSVKQKLIKVKQNDHYCFSLNNLSTAICRRQMVYSSVFGIRVSFIFRLLAVLHLTER